MKTITTMLKIASISAVFILICSCQKDNYDTGSVEKSIVKLAVGQDFKNTSALGNVIDRRLVKVVQTVEIPYDKQFSLIATLTAENTPASDLKSSNHTATLSTNTEKQILKEGTKYQVAIFDADGNYKLTKSFTKTNDNQDFVIDNGKYIFVVYASGTNKTLPSIPQGAKLSTLNFENLTADTDFMLDQIPVEIKDGRNELNIDLKHLFTQVSLKFDASEIGEISSIGGVNINPSVASVDVALSEGKITFKGNTAAVPMPLKNTNGKIILSEPTFITTAATSSGTIVLSNVSIGGSAPRNLTKGGWKLIPGVKYELDITLKGQPNNKSVKIAGAEWASGNLTYKDGIYSFVKRSDEIGAYWFAGYSKPRIQDANNLAPSVEVNGIKGDPCALVKPHSEWRLPTFDEAYSLMLQTNGTKRPERTPPNRYADYYLGNSGGNSGVFFGIGSNPVELKENYLFLPFGGSYINDENLNELGLNAYYLLANANLLRFKYSQSLPSFASDYSLGSSLESNRAVQIRCVKNTVLP